MIKCIFQLFKCMIIKKNTRSMAEDDDCRSVALANAIDTHIPHILQSCKKSYMI